MKAKQGILGGWVGRVFSVTLVTVGIWLLASGFGDVPNHRLAGASPFDPSQARRLPVPYYSQGATRWCFNDSLSMVLRYFGKSVAPEDIARAFQQGPEQSMNFLDVLAGRVGTYVSQWPDLALEQSVRSWNFSEYRSRIEAGCPVITSYYGVPGHTVVVVGYSVGTPGDYLYVHDPSGFLTELKWRTGARAYARVPWESFREVSWSQTVLHPAAPPPPTKRSPALAQTAIAAVR